VNYRSFYASDGRRWEVWLILPTSAERRAEERRSVRGVRVPERRLTRERRRRAWTPIGVDPAFEKGWLCFETDGEKRRLAPIPEGWDAAEVEQLEAWCGDALIVPKCSP